MCVMQVKFFCGNFALLIKSYLWSVQLSWTEYFYPRFDAVRYAHIQDDIANLFLSASANTKAKP